jgi:beta-glucosidase
VQGMDASVAAGYGTLVMDDPRAADVVILRVPSPVTVYPYGGAFTGGAAAAAAAGASQQPPPIGRFGVTLAYGNADNWGVLENIKKITAAGKPTIVVVNMDRPVILTEFINEVQAVFGGFGASDRAILDLIFGKATPTGKLPFDLPSDMVTVMSQAADVPFDMDEPLFKFGFGLIYNRP